MFRFTSTDGVVTRAAMPTWFQRIRFAEPRLHQTIIRRWRGALGFGEGPFEVGIADFAVFGAGLFSS
jgi:hypothetical protein